MENNILSAILDEVLSITLPADSTVKRNAELVKEKATQVLAVLPDDVRTVLESLSDMDNATTVSEDIGVIKGIIIATSMIKILSDPVAVFNERLERHQPTEKVFADELAIIDEFCDRAATDNMEGKA